MLRLIGGGISYNTSTQTTTKIMRLIVFSTKDSLGLTTGTLGQSNLFRSPGIANAAKGFIDLHKVNIHYDRKLTIEPAVDGRNQHRSGSIVVPFKLQNLTFESDSTSVYLKNKQYYFTFGYYADGRYF